LQTKNYTFLFLSVAVMLIGFGLINNFDYTSPSDSMKLGMESLFSNSGEYLTGAVIGIGSGDYLNLETSLDSENIVVEGDLTPQAPCASWPCNCGDDVTGSIIMNSDLSCTIDGLNVGASTITIDCAGYSIIGDGGDGDTGIKNSAPPGSNYANVTIKNCVIKNFGVGINFFHSPNGTIWNNTVGHINLTVPSGGITFTNSSDANISDNVITNVTCTGIDSPYAITYAEAPASALSGSIISHNNISRIYGANNSNPIALKVGDSAILDLIGLEIVNNTINNINCTEATGGTACAIIGGVGMLVRSGINVNITNNNITFVGAGLIADQFGLRITGNYFGAATLGLVTLFQGAGTRFNHSWVENNTFDGLTQGINLQTHIFNNTFINNNFTNNLQFSILDYSKYNNTLIFNNSMGEIKWEKINISTNISLARNVSTYVKSNQVGLNSSLNSLSINETAQITFKGLNNSVHQLFKDAVRCDNGDTCNITSDSNGIVVARVSSFSNYTTAAADNVSPIIFVQSPVGSSNGTLVILNITTDESATCYYKNTTINYTMMNVTSSVTTHQQNVTNLSVGNRRFDFLCNDSSGNNVTKTIYALITNVSAAFTNTTYINLTGNSTFKVNNTFGVNLTFNVSKTFANNFTVVAQEFNATPESTALSVTGYTISEYKYYTFSAPAVSDYINKVTVRVAYNETILTTNSITEANLKFYYYNPATAAWTEESVVSVNTASNFIEANLTHLSTFVIAEQTATSSDDSSSSSSSSGSGTNAWGLCGDGNCNDGLTCAPDVNTNNNNGACYKDCGLCKDSEGSEGSEGSTEKGTESTDGKTSADNVLEEGTVQMEKGRSNLAGQASGFVGSFVNLGWLWVTLAIVVLIGWMSSLAYHRKSLKGKR
jgi:hypothetical protein